MEVCPYIYFRWCGYCRGPWLSFDSTDEFLVRVTKITSRIVVSWSYNLHFNFWPIFNSMKWPCYQKYVNKITLSHTTLRFYLHEYSMSSFEFCWMWTFPWIILSWHSCSMWDKLGWLKWLWQFFCEELSSFNPTGFCYSYAWFCSLCEGRTSFCKGLISRKFCGFLLMFSTVLLIFPLSITFFVFMHRFWCYFI